MPNSQVALPKLKSRSFRVISIHFGRKLGDPKFFAANFLPWARQVCKDKVPAPSDLVRSEVEMLRSLEHPAIPQARLGVIVLSRVLYIPIGSMYGIFTYIW